MTPRQRAFVESLRDIRHDRGLTPEQIAAATNIRASFFESLERGDVSRWPPGLYRRAFFRAYVAALGLDPEPLMHKFRALFPENGSAPVITAPNALRLTLDVDEHAWARTAMRALPGVAFDVTLIVTGAALVTFGAGVDFWMTIAILALFYCVLSGVVVGRGSALLAVGRRIAQPRQMPRRVLRLVPTGRRPANRRVDAADDDAARLRAAR